MPVHPQESPKARAETRKTNLAAASTRQQPHSPAGSDLRGPHPDHGRSEWPGQLFRIDTPPSRREKVFLILGAAAALWLIILKIAGAL